MPNTKAKTRKRVRRLLNAKLKKEGRTPAQIKRNKEKAARKNIIMLPIYEIDDQSLLEGYDGNNQVNNYA